MPFQGIIGASYVSALNHRERAITVMQAVKNIYQNQAIRELERIAIQDFNIAEYELMNRAGQGAFDVLQQTWPTAKKIAVVCGAGNNGGDGYVIARLAKKQGLEVTVLHIGSLERLKGAALTAMQDCGAASVPLAPFKPYTGFHTDVVVDAVLGTGLQGNVRGELLAAIEAINAAQAPVLAIDVPSGLDVDTGRVLGKAVKAQRTVTFIGNKPGLMTAAGREHCGVISCNDLQIPQAVFDQVEPSAHCLDMTQLLQTYLPPRNRNAHKGDFGHVLIVGGDFGMAGAVRMAAEAAARVGAGLVSVATQPEHIGAINAARPEIMCHGIVKNDQLSPLLQRATVVVVGPGIGQQPWGQNLLAKVLASDLPLVVDADALNIMALASTKKTVQRDNWVLTPHPGEAARLLNSQTQKVQEDRFAAVRQMQQAYHGVVVLKGAGSLITDGDGIVSVCPNGNPGMASGGMGDVLSGVIGGLVAQAVALRNAAELGVCLHATAADHAASHGERGMLALDLLPCLRQLVNAQ